MCDRQAPIRFEQLFFWSSSLANEKSHHIDRNRGHQFQFGWPRLSKLFAGQNDLGFIVNQGDD
jgi:hypothetical protein